MKWLLSTFLGWVVLLLMVTGCIVWLMIIAHFLI